MLEKKNDYELKLNEWFDDVLWKVKQGSPRKETLNFSVIALSENKHKLYFYFFPSWMTKFHLDLYLR